MSELLKASFRRLVTQIEDRGLRLSHTVLGSEGWTMLVNPRPLCVFRVRFDRVSGELAVHRRRPLLYRELLRRTVDELSLDDTARDVLALLAPPPTGTSGRASRPTQGRPRASAREPGWPQLKPFADLTPDDFARHPVWINCHVEDYDEPWYDQTDEETFRPWTAALPVSPSQGMFLVRATARCRDGAALAGFLTPSADDDLGTIQPHVFVENTPWGFWGGRPGVTAGWRQRFYEASQKEPEEIFPLAIAADDGLATGVVSCRVDGFYWRRGKRTTVEQ